MSDQFRRFEVLIPLRFNDGREVPDDLIVDSILELETQFGLAQSRVRRRPFEGSGPKDR